MDGNNHQGSDSEYVSQYDDDEEFGHIRRSRRLRLRFNRPGQARMRCIDPSEEDEEEEEDHRGIGIRRSERIDSRLKSYQRDYLNSSVYEDDVQARANHKYPLRRLRNRLTPPSGRALSAYHADDRQSGMSGLGSRTSYGTHGADTSSVSGTRTSPRRLRVRTKKINYEERKPTIQLEDELDAAIDLNKALNQNAQPAGYKKPSYQTHRQGSLSYGVGSGGAGIFGKDYEEEEVQRPILQYNQCVRQIKLLPKELQEKSRDILQMHLENRDFPELPPFNFKKVDFDDIVGHDEHVCTLKEMMKISLMYPELSNRGLDIAKGILFYGPPGTGKTMTARALASSCSTPDHPVSFFFCSCADVQSKWFGESEKHLKQLFEQAKASEPSILFFDEIDGLTPTRSSGENAHYNTIVNTLLMLMDGLKGRGQVIVIAATNRLDTIDPAFLRPGRFDRILEFGLPDRDTRLKMIEKQTSSFKVSEKVMIEMSKATQGCNGADVKFLCSAAFFRALKRYYPKILSSKKRIPLNLSNIKVKMADFSVELAEMRNSSGADHVIEAESGIEKLLPDTWDAIFALLDSNFKILLNKLQPRMYKRSNYYEPRVLVTGPPYTGQIQLGHFIKRWLVDKGFRVEILAYPSIENIESTVQTLQYSRLRAILITNVENWASHKCEPLKHLELCLSEIYTVPVIVVGIESTGGEPDEDIARFFQCRTELIENLFHLRGAIKILPPTPDSRQNYFKLFTDELKGRIYSSILREKRELKNGASVENKDDTECEQESDQDEPSIMLSEAEMRRIEQKFQEVHIELKQRLRGFHRSLSKKHRVFTQPFDSEKYPGYDKVALCSMDLNTMLGNIDANLYFHPDEWMRDIDTIFQNTLTYHTRVKRIQEVMHKAFEFRDYAGALLNTIPSISRLNYWQLKMWNTTKDKLFARVERGNTTPTLRPVDTATENTLSSSNDTSNCIKSSARSDAFVSSRRQNDNNFHSHGNTLNRGGHTQCAAADTPVVKHRKYEIPIDIFSSDSSDHHSEADLAPKYDVAGRIDQLARNDADGNVRGVQDHLSGSSNEEPDADEIPKPNIRNNAREDSTTKGDMCDSDEEIDYTDPETESSLESLLSRLVSLTGVMPVNDIITLSAVLWNIIAIDDNGDNFPKTLLSDVDNIVSKVESKLKANLVSRQHHTRVS